MGVAVHEWRPTISAHVIAVIVGVVLANTGIVSPATSPGLRMAARRILRIGIVVLGLRLSLGEVADLGPKALLAVVIVVVITFVGTRWIGRQLGLSPGLSMLVATGYSICGASAIAAAEPFSDASEEEVAYALGLVTLCGSLAIFVLPPLGSALGLSSADFGAWVGASVHDVGQVVAAASTRDAAAVSSAVVVKLTRVAMLAPLLGYVAFAARRRATSSHTEQSGATTAARPPVLPLFVALFLVMVLVRSTGLVPDAWLAAAKHLETVLIGMGLVGLGSQVHLGRLRHVGGRPLVLGLASWVLVAGASLGVVLVLQ